MAPPPDEFDYLTLLPEQDRERFLSVLAGQDDPRAKKLLEDIKARREKERLLKESSSQTETWLAKFITQDKDMISLKDEVRKLSKANAPVLITGETGTGKELIARALHGDRTGKFVDLNCAGLPEHLIESELFGHVKGAFTGAIEAKVGLIYAAQGGTLFLDEIGELNPKLQAKLLRAIQERQVRAVGAEKNRDITCRFIAATHHSLESRVKSGEFREDLFWRLCTFELRTKPLINRLEDIPMIIESLGVKDYPFKDWIVGDLLKGNVRSLQTWIERWKVLGKVPKI